MNDTLAPLRHAAGITISPWSDPILAPHGLYAVVQDGQILNVFRTAPEAEAWADEYLCRLADSGLIGSAI